MIINQISYISAVYFAVTTMLTVGYGDIVPGNKIEKVFSIFSILITCCVFAYTMNVVGNVLENLN